MPLNFPSDFIDLFYNDNIHNSIQLSIPVDNYGYGINSDAALYAEDSYYAEDSEDYDDMPPLIYDDDIPPLIDDMSPIICVGVTVLCNAYIP